MASDGVAVAKQSMELARVHFGCALSQHDRRVAVVGGQINATNTSDQCELYDIDKNTWA